ncbi:MAG: bifunctional phosphoribosyl-AMP cyclohydrolase/phosphoribosyl-ATP diphosphatase HisIE [Bacillota bacterium]|jgi:phosphoribosyl-ATP pyrophosphohydrolase/phosphoribosyl-AMP cyclohydrolase|nr:bifunctional phosphoribosyl-AMP cyclohydrolase/phosphoribosyl-ATP diphosphatase HisIE [Bacillota bacterium]
MKGSPVLGDEKEIQAVLGGVKFNEDGLIPAVVQDVATGEVLMVAYMNRESLIRSLQTGRTWFYSRSRQRLWLKGETSGNHQYIREVRIDCDGDALLFKVEQLGAACHEGYRSCFFRCLGMPLVEGERQEVSGAGIIDELFAVIKERQETLPEDSYTAKLFRKGIDKITKKLGEEAVEVVIAGKNRDRAELVEEAADLIYHLLVLLAECNVSPGEVRAKLAQRRR